MHKIKQQCFNTFEIKPLKSWTEHVPTFDPGDTGEEYGVSVSGRNVQVRKVPVLAVRASDAASAVYCHE